MTLLGFGTVGTGVARVLADHGEELGSRGVVLDLVAVADSHSAAVDKRRLDPEKLLARKKSTGRVGEDELDAVHLIREVESDVVVELIPAGHGNGEPALSHVREALKASRNVVTANKMPLALEYSALMSEAARRGVKILCGACVGGGLPVLEMGSTLGTSDSILAIDAVLNATSNYVLTKMEEGTEYDSAVEEAKRLGYAETDPTLDVNGHDAACKIVILSNYVLGRSFSLNDVSPFEGIAGVSAERVRDAASSGRALRLVARMHESPEVVLSEIDARSLLNVWGPSNSVVFHCKDSGDRAIAGLAGGSIPTAQAVLRDLVNLAVGKTARP